MKKKKITGLVLAMLLFVLAACGDKETAEIPFGEEQVMAAFPRREEKIQNQEEVSSSLQELEVHFLDVGQGDATLLMCGEEAMLIDVGDDSQGTTVWNYLQKQGVDRLKYLVLTHTDADHIGGSDVVISKFAVDHVFIGDFPKDSNVYRDLMNALKDQGYPWHTPEVGSTYSLGTAKFTILAPNRSYDDPNNCSIALLVENGDDRFLFTGDAEEEAEQDILATGLSVECDVFKAGHHGSKTSNSIEFLQAASPKTVVISCGENNSYGHPHAASLNTFRSMGVTLYRTDEQGSLVATSTGEKITWNTAASDSWQAGEPKGSAKNTGNQNNKGSQNAGIQNSGKEPTISMGEKALVWKSVTGEKYHSINDCGRMNPDKAVRLTKEEAEGMGLQACDQCY